MVSSKMASVRKLWKLKASIRSPGDFSQIGRSSTLVLDIEALSTQPTKSSVMISATTLGGCSLLPHPFRKFFSSSLGDHPSTVYSSNAPALSPLKAFSYLLCTPSICSPLLAGYSSLQGTRESDDSVSCKSEGVSHTNLRLLSGACCLPHPKKVETGGEDAYFICSKEQVVGIADGVGGWADVGVDAGDYARELMLQSSIAVAQEPHGCIDPARVMMRAHARTKFRGSSTACILALSNNVLRAANLGDSGFMLMRNGRAIFKSPVQQHQFNFPFQLESGGSDCPSTAEVFSLHVAAGDIVIAGTDGLFDNLFDNELMGIVVQSSRAGLDPEITAQNIVALARKRAGDRSRQTPFSTAAQEAGYRFYGGKMDDITVIVSYITTTKA